MFWLPLRTYSWPGISCYAGHDQENGVPIGGQTGLNRRVNSPKISRIRPTLPQSAPRTFIRNKSERKLRFRALLPRASLRNPMLCQMTGARPMREWVASGSAITPRCTQRDWRMLLAVFSAINRNAPACCWLHSSPLTGWLPTAVQVQTDSSVSQRR
jgi:hypothetical protein